MYRRIMQDPIKPLETRTLIYEKNVEVITDVDTMSSLTEAFVYNWGVMYRRIV